MGLTFVSLRVFGKTKFKSMVAAVDTGFVGDLITRSEFLKDLDVELKWERVRTIADGKRVTVRYGLGSGEVMGEVTSLDLEVWDELKLPENTQALLGATALEKLGLRVDPKTGRLEKTDLYLL